MTDKLRAPYVWALIAGVLTGQPEILGGIAIIGLGFLFLAAAVDEA